VKTLRITQLKPNPLGKDRTRHGGATATQLGAEWVDFRNSGTFAVNLSGVALYHVAYSSGEPRGHWEQITIFQGVLPVGEVVRVHSGQVRPLNVLNPEDVSGAHHHLFTGRDAYVWNNREGDTAALWESNAVIDKASYAPNPPEGVVLVRSGDYLVPAGVAQRAY
jgi:hypothetical protein